MEAQPAGSHQEWRQWAACRGLDPDLFYPFESDVEAVEDAKRVCSQCLAQAACLEYALSIREPEGIWGGATAQERRRIIRQRRRHNGD